MTEYRVYVYGRHTQLESKRWLLEGIFRNKKEAIKCKKECEKEGFTTKIVKE